jgi:DNA-binding SARP family transcriptional activator
MLRLELFGAMKVCVRALSGAPQTLALSGKPSGLLAYLAMAHGQFFSRNELTQILWSDQTEGASSGCFNTVLWRLRSTLSKVTSPIVMSDRRGAIGLNPDIPIELDVLEFEHRVAPALAKPLSLCKADDIHALRQGVALYKGDILAGFQDDWALREREKHRRLQLNALGRLMQLCALNQDWAGAINHAQHILDLDPLREDVHRELMALYLQSGQRALALRQFETCRTALKRELAIAPMFETQSLYQQISNAAVHPQNPNATPPKQHPTPQGLIEQALAHMAQANDPCQMTLPFLVH